MLKKLKRRFVLFTMAIVLVMLVGIFVMLLHSTARRLEDENLRLMQQLVSQPELPEPPGMPGKGPDRISLPYFVLQLDQSGELLGAEGTYYDLSDEEFLTAVLDAAEQSPEESGLLWEYELRFLKDESPKGRKIVFADVGSEKAALQSLVQGSLAIGSAALLAFFFISLLLARSAVKPVERSWEQQRRFVADASHELKTPLTVIMTNAELLQSGCSPQERERFAAGILSMSRQMRGLVESMLELARSEGENRVADHEELDLSALAEEGILPFEPLFFESGLELKADIAPGLRLRGSRRELRQVLDILLDNACKYSPPGGQVRLTLRRQGCHCRLTVSNPGQLDRRELQDIFKRFYRVDKVRGANGSYGLGLPIARGIALAHKGRIWAECSGGRVSFHVQLPLI